MTRTAVRRRVDVNDGRLVIRKIVVETSECFDIAAGEPQGALAGAGEVAAHPRWLRRIKPGRHALRARQTLLL